LRGAMKTGCRAILNCVKAAGTTVQDVDFLAVCTCTGYVCPDVGSRLIAHMGFSNNLQRASIVGERSFRRGQRPWRALRNGRGCCVWHVPLCLEYKTENYRPGLDLLLIGKRFDLLNDQGARTSSLEDLPVGSDFLSCERQ